VVVLEIVMDPAVEPVSSPASTRKTFGAEESPLPMSAVTPLETGAIAIAPLPVINAPPVLHAMSSAFTVTFDAVTC